MLNSYVFETTRRKVLIGGGVSIAAILSNELGLPFPALAGGAFRLAMPEDALTLDPIVSSDNASIWTELLIFDQLVRPSRDLSTTSSCVMRNSPMATR